MELVMSPGNLGDNDGSPFRNEDVQEWSRVDRLTGMLERARIETGRWRTNTQGAALAYGKMIDSRERNSADGNLVQKARRQVEVFQSKAPSGRSYECIKASQWASSRVVDSAFDIPPTRPINRSRLREMRTDDLDSNFGIWGLREQHSDLDRLTYLCRKLHNEAMNSVWSFGRSSSPLSIHKNGFDDLNDDHVLHMLADKQRASSEDLVSLIETENISPGQILARNSKVRRSLQIPNSLDRSHERWRSSCSENRIESNEEVNEDHKIGNQVEQNGCPAERTYFDHIPYSFDSQKPSKLHDTSNEGKIYNRPVRRSSFESPTLLKTNYSQTVPFKSKTNKTALHLRNDSPIERVTNKTNFINATKFNKEPKKLHPATNEQESARKAYSESPIYGTLMESSSLPKEETSSTSGKPVKKVEFCKTEIHFAPDSGTVDIVETDGKPPPSNKFRRRRRNSIRASSKKNLPLVHFGDTSYEKYIFGGGKMPKKSPILDTDKIHKSSQTDSVNRENDKFYNEDFISRNDGDKTDKTADQKYRGNLTLSNLVADKSNISKDNPSNVVSYMNCLSRKNEDTELKNQNSQVVSKDSDNNQVLLKVVTTHKPTVARVESDHVPKITKIFESNKEIKIKPAMSENNENYSLKSQSNKLEAKEHCDNSKEEEESVDPIPTYENVFEMSSAEEPLYENFQVIKNIPHEKVYLNKISKNEILADTANRIKVNSKEKRIPNTIGMSKSVEITTGISNDKKIKKELKNDKKSVKPLSTSSNKNIRTSIRDTLSRVSKDSRDVKTETPKIKQNTLIKKKESLKLDSKSQQIDGSVPETKISSRLKKPVEVVYQTAVFNMKNEKLSKTAKKGSKGGYINDLICGSKTKRPSDNKRVKTAVISHNTGNQQETLRTSR